MLSTDENGQPRRHGGDYGFYGVLDQKIYRERSGGEQGLGLFFQFGGAPDDRNTVDYYFGAGLHYTGLLPGRDQDAAGIAVANAFLSERARQARALEIEAFDPSAPDAGPRPQAFSAQESVLEITYQIRVHERVALQPDYQIVFNPGGREDLETAHVFILRLEVTL